MIPEKRVDKQENEMAAGISERCDGVTRDEVKAV